MPEETNALVAVRSPRYWEKNAVTALLRNRRGGTAKPPDSAARRRGVGPIGVRGVARIALASIVASLLVATAVKGGGTGKIVQGDRVDCLQRVKVWSPSRQAHVVRLQSFCG